MRTVLNRWASRIVAVSDSLRNQYLAAGGIDPKKVITVHNGIEIERFERSAVSGAELRAQFGIPPASKLVVTVSVLRPGKGIEVLLAAIATIVDRVPDAYFLIVGDGPQRAEWQTLAQSLGVAGRVRWAGYRRDVDAILPGCDLFVLPSLQDAFPTVLLEAMAAGLPAVASAVGGIPEIVVPGETGVLVPANDSAQLAAAISGVLLDEAVASKMRRCARVIAKQRFSTAAWVARLEGVYGSVLAESESARS